MERYNTEKYGLHKRPYKNINVPQPKYCILLAVNHLLIDRVSGGPGFQQNKSNNDTKIRPGATEFIQFLYNSGMFYMGFYAYMNRDNLIKIVKIILQGGTTGMCMNRNISIIPGLSVQESKDEYNILRSKSILIERINEDRLLKFINGFGPKPLLKFNNKNTIVVDFMEQNIEEDTDISVIIPKWDRNEKNDKWMYILKNIFENFVNHQTDTQIDNSEKLSLVEYVKCDLSIIKEAIQSSMICEF